MPRAPFTGICFLAAGCALGAGATFMLGWMVENLLEGPLTRDVLGSVPLVSVIGYLVVMMALRCFRTARTSFLAWGFSQDGEVRAEFTSQPRVGCRLEGVIHLKQGPLPGQVFQVRVMCTRMGVTALRGTTRQAWQSTDHLHYEGQEVTAIGDAGAWRLPFAFDIPVDVPLSPIGFDITSQQPYWCLALVNKKLDGSDAHEIEFRMGLAPVRVGEARIASSFAVGSEN